MTPRRRKARRRRRRRYREVKRLRAYLQSEEHRQHRAKVERGPDRPPNLVGGCDQ